VTIDRQSLYRSLARPADSRILYFVIDGIGGLPREPGGATELETAATPTLDRLADEGSTGLITPVAPGVAPGSGPGHLSLFGFDPLATLVGRGVLAALGIGFDLRLGDVAARINFCTLDGDGNVADRRAGRISSELGAPLAARLDGIEVGGDVTCIVRHVKEYRACVIFRGPGLDGRVADTDPQATGVPPEQPAPLDPAAERTAKLAAEFIGAAAARLAGEERANGILLRGFDSFHRLPGFEELYLLKAAAVAAYPMYRGVARAIGMTVFESADTLASRVELTREALAAHDFIFVHFKATDSRGEDGDFDAKVEQIEGADQTLAALLELDFDVVAVTGDHSTPATYRAHSWHPVPVLIWGPHCRANGAPGFGETACLQGALGQIRSMDVMPLVLAQAGRLEKFGA
jgi:2,3-bisphosphoglycerate-independent phosphoglycerate mutase